MGRAQQALSIARAALMEVCENPDAVFIKIDDEGEEVISCRSNMVSNVSVGRQAIRLAAMATRGPTALCRCDLCSPGGISRGKPRCTPIIDAMRGVTCQ